MLKNRYINFGFFLVFILTFVIVIDAPGNSAYAEHSANVLPEHVLIVTYDADTGEVFKVESNGEEGLITIAKKPYKSKVNKHVKNAWPAMLFTYRGSNCISFVIGGAQYSYCW